MSRTVLIKVAENENDDGIELPTENDSSLKLETVLSKFPDCFALAYKSGKSKNTWTAVEKKNGKFIPPQGGWGAGKYVCARGKKIKFKLTNLADRLTKEELQKYLESYGIVEIEKFDKKKKTASVTIKFMTDTDLDVIKTQQHRFIIEEVVKTNVEKFTKRSGTTNLGHEFEELTMAALLLNLTLDKNVKDFTMSSNDEEFGSFDDIVADIELTNGDVYNYAIQLKYKNDPKQSLKNFLTCGNGEFSIQKYCNDFTEMTEHTKYHNLILFTNLKFNMKQGELLKLDNSNTELEIVEEKSPEAFGGGPCYKFNSDISDHRRMFFNKFSLYPNQPNIQKMKQNLEEKFAVEFSSKNAANHYLEFISEWNKKVRKKRLNKRFMKQLIALQLLTSSIKSFPFVNRKNVNEKISFVKQAILNFNVTVVEEIHFESVKKLWESEIANAPDIEKIIDEFHLRKLSDDEKRVAALWIMDKCPLIITQSDTAYKVISLCPEKYFILLKNNDSEVQVQNLKFFTKLTDLEANTEIYKNITKSFQCSIQGKEAFNLEDLIQECKSFKNTVTTNELIQMVDGPLMIGQQETVLDIYIDRQVTRLTVEYNFFDNVDKDTLVIISCQGKEHTIKDRLKNVNLIDVEDYLNEKQTLEMETFGSSQHQIEYFENSKEKNVYFTTTQCTRVTFDIICNKNSDKKKCHHFRILEDEILEWMYSKGEISDLQRYKTNSSFLKERDLITAEQTVNIITADPGMGKTELMKKFTKNYSSSFWIILISARDWSEFVNCSNEHFFNIVIENTCKTKFEEEILKVMKNSKRITFIWDGLDELSNTYVDTTIKLIGDLVKEGFIQWISCRKHLEDKLEKKFNVLSRSITKFDKDEQSNYICRRLNSNKEINLEEVVHKIQNYIDRVQYNEILGIPLQIFMLTELLLNKPELLHTLLNEVFPITDLYKHFINIKLEIFFKDKNKLTEQNFHIKSMIIDYQMKNHQRAAILTTLEQQFRDKLDINSLLKMSNEEDIYKIGIITGKADNGKSKFLHFSYAEYLAALYLYEHRDKFSESIREHIFLENYQNIRFMFDLLLARNCPAHLAVLYNNFGYLKCCEEYYSCKDEGGRNPLQIACSWGPRFPLLKTKGFIYRLIDDEQADMVNLSNRQHYDEMLDLLLRHNSVEDKDMLFHLNSIEYADLTLSLKPFAVFLKKRYHLLFHTLKNFKDTPSVLYYSIKFNYWSILHGFQNIPFVNLIKNRNSILHMASESNSLDCIKILLTKSNYRFKINMKNQYGTTPISIAAEKGYFKIVKYLAESGADVNIQNQENKVPIHFAAENGHIEVVKLLVKDLKANVNAKSEKGSTPIYFAAGKGHYEVVKYLTKSGADVNIQNQKGNVPIHFAAQNGHIEVVKLLVKDLKANVNAKSNEGVTPIYLAAFKGHYEVVKYLAKSGADVNIQDQKGFVPIHTAAFGGHIEVVKLLINDLKANVNAKDNKSFTPIYFSAQNGHCEVVKYLAKLGADVNIQNPDGWVPIHAAAQFAHIEVVKLLVNDLKANVNAKSNEGFTPIYCAAQNGHYEVVKYLAKSGADVNIQNQDGFVPIHVAAQNGHIKVVKLLVDDLKANVNAKDNKGFTPINPAAFNGHYEVVKYLAKSGADVNIQNQDGCVPIHVAALNGHIEVVKLLVDDLKANVNAKSNEGVSPIYLAAFNGHYEVVKYLAESGADLPYHVNLTPSICTLV